LLLAFVVPFVGTALAGHTTTHDLECTPETDQNPTGTQHTIVCTVFGADANEVSGTEVDFEIEDGSANNPDGNGDETTPEGTCTIAGVDNGGTAGVDETNQCSFTYTGNNAGTDTIRAFIDDGQNNANNTDGNDADLTEGPDSAENANEPAGTTGQAAGSKSEPDDTDVVQKSWFAQFPNTAALNCGPEEATNPATGTGSTETYTCTLFNDANSNDEADAGEGALQGIRIDGENLGTPDNVNDPDNGTNTPTADYNDACTTDANGQCTINIPASEAQAGTTEICFWADPDADNQFVAGGGDANDGGECNEGLTADENDNQTDVVEKTWVAPNTPQDLDAEPESAQNIVGTSHTVTATVTDINGNPVQGVPVDFTVTGRNNGDGCDNVTTNANGQAVCTYTDSGAPIVTGDGSDISDRDDIQVCEDVNGNCDDVQKFWFAAAPTADEVNVDMQSDSDSIETDPTQAPGGGQPSSDGTCSIPGQATSSNTVGQIHQVCVTVRNAQDQIIPGEQVTFELDGPGTFVTEEAYDEAQDWTCEAHCSGQTPRNGELPEDSDLGSSVTVQTDENGQAFAWVYSEVTGTTTVSAQADSATDTGTKTWTSGLPRVVDCSPNSATNQVNTTHTVTCDVTDHLGNPVPNAFLVADENGEGTTTNQSAACATFSAPGDDCDYTDNSGQAEFTTTSSTAGNQTLAVEIAGFRGEEMDEDSDVGDNDATETPSTADDECDLAAGFTFAMSHDSHQTANDSWPDQRVDSAGVCQETVSKTWSTTAPTPTGGFPRAVTLESSKNKVVYGNGFTLTATVTATSADTPASCVQGVTVTFQREIVGTAGSEVVGTATTDANGEASLPMSGDRSANYVASVDQTAGCSDAASAAEAVLVKKKVKLRVSDQTPERGTRVRFKVTVLPCGGADGPGHEGDRVQLYKTVGGQLAKIDAKRTNDNCKATFKKRARGSNTYQARSPKSDDDHLGGKSRKKAVQAHR